MDDKNQAFFNINSVHYPHNLAKQYPQILHKIIALWDSELIDDYFSGLILDTRNDQRQGFPVAVADEILRLSRINERYRESKKPHSWHKVADKDKMELGNLGYKYAPHDFVTAAKAGNANAINIYLRTRAPTETEDEQSWTPLMHAAACGHEQVAAILLNHQANPNAKDKNGYGALHWAAFHGHHLLVKLLVSHKADIAAKSKLGWTALLQAASQGHILAAQVLIDSGADVNGISNDHWTPLQKAAANGHLDMVKLLISRGADWTRPRHNGSTALSLSATGKHQAISELLSSLPEQGPAGMPVRR